MRQFYSREYSQIKLRESQFCCYCGSLMNKGDTSLTNKSLGKFLCLSCIEMSRQAERQFIQDYMKKILEILVSKGASHNVRLIQRTDDSFPVKLWLIECQRCYLTANFETRNNVISSRVFKDPSLKPVVLFAQAIGPLFHQHCHS